MSDKIYIIHDTRVVPGKPINLKEKKGGIIEFKLNEIANGECFNGNRRKYPWQYLYDSIFSKSIIPSNLKNRTCFNECTHPEDKSISRQMILDRERSATMLTSLSARKPIIGGTFETLATKRGNDFKQLTLVNGCNLGYSLRAASKLIPLKDGYFESDQSMISFGWDEVNAPALHNARVFGDLSTTMSISDNKKMIDAYPVVEDEKRIEIILDSLKFDPAHSKIDKNGNIICNDAAEGDTLVIETHGGFRKSLLELF